MNAARRIKRAEKALPGLLEAARANFHDAPEIRTAVLIAWVALAGVVGWTPQMVRVVEREVARTA